MTVFLRIFLLCLILLSSEGLAGELAFIVHQSNTITELSSGDVSEFYLKKKRAWPDGTTVRFIDQVDDSANRTVFLKNFLKQSSREVDLYWIGQKMATGNSSPLQVASDTLVSTLVSRFPGAIGYVSPDFIPPAGVKKITITTGSP